MKRFRYDNGYAGRDLRFSQNTWNCISQSIINANSSSQLVLSSLIVNNYNNTELLSVEFFKCVPFIVKFEATIVDIDRLQNLISVLSNTRKDCMTLEDLTIRYNGLTEYCENGEDYYYDVLHYSDVVYGDRIITKSRSYKHGNIDVPLLQDFVENLIEISPLLKNVKIYFPRKLETVGFKGPLEMTGKLQRFEILYYDYDYSTITEKRQDLFSKEVGNSWIQRAFRNDREIAEI